MTDKKKPAADKSPPYPGTRLRPVRVEDDLWDEALEITKARGETNSSVMRAGLERYVKRHRGKTGE